MLFLDIETAPIVGYAWEKYDTCLIDNYRDWTVFSMAYKWRDEAVKCITIDYPKSLTDFMLSPDNDKELVKTIWGLLNRADVVVGHNSDRFDLRKLNSRFIYYGLGPPAPYKTVDTKKASCRVASNTSNKLNDLGKKYQIGKKIEHEGFELWVKCMSGDPQAWQHMIKYNKQDVVLLEKLYDFLLPWIPNHPNVSVISGIANVCPKCGKTGFNKEGIYHNKTTKYQVWRCKNCRAQLRTTFNLQETKPLVAI